MPPRAPLQIYTVRTRHGSKGQGDGTGNSFIAPTEVEASSYEEAACKRFDMLSEREKPRCIALLVTTQYGAPQLFEVEKISSPYKVRPA